jgi:hypothetical protein
MVAAECQSKKSVDARNTAALYPPPKRPISLCFTPAAAKAFTVPSLPIQKTYASPMYHHAPAPSAVRKREGCLDWPYDMHFEPLHPNHIHMHTLVLSRRPHR